MSGTRYQLKNIQHFYDGKKVLDIQDLEIESGTITSLAGPNGSGKSTLLKLLAFVMKPTSGKILYRGRPEFPFSPSIRSKITLLTQTPYLLNRTVFENIAYGLKIRKDRRNRTERIRTALEEVGLDFDRFSTRRREQLSGGEAQRVALAARLVLQPDVLLLDEPVASVDMESAELIRKASLKARETWGTTLVVVSHDRQWLYSVSDRQISVSGGKLFATGDENAIPEPYEEKEDGTWIKRTPDNLEIRLSSPPGIPGLAVIQTRDIRFETQDRKHSPGQGENRLPAVIQSMVLEKRSGQILAGIQANGINLTLRISPEQVSKTGMQPGKQIFLCFQPDQVRWV